MRVQRTGRRGRGSGCRRSTWRRWPREMPRSDAIWTGGISSFSRAWWMGPGWVRAATALGVDGDVVSVDSDREFGEDAQRSGGELAHVVAGDVPAELAADHRGDL